MGKKRKIFIDGGAHYGESIEMFLQNYSDSNAWDFELFSFEANPKLLQTVDAAYNQLTAHNPQLQLSFFPGAIWVENTNVDFYTGTSHYSGTTNKHKTTGGVHSSNKVSIPGIDFNAWIIKNFNSNDYIILKLDIEGGEYDVLPHMILNGSMGYIDKLYIEWHHNKLTNVTEETHNNLLEVLKTKYNIIPEYWSAEQIKKGNQSI